ncbi:MAG TPA: M20 family metallopeptidase [Candidatus Limnocylindrales bacterium]|nr:M20 family metallopeptidase [Candidatus Limnocylindrales bacterium]
MTASPADLVPAADLAALRAAVERAYPAFLADLERLVNIDCGSYTADGVDEVGRWTRARLEALGATVTVHPNDLGLGSTVIAELAGDDPAGPTLLAIGHMDTVFDPGTAAARPFTVDERGIATGPGVTDMKSGLLAGLYALAALRETGGLPLARVIFVGNPDEEIGSPVSTPHIRRLASEADACLVLECARMNGDIVSARKGNLGLTITITGRAAHAGVEPEKGRSAILEAARLVTDLHALNGRWPGVTVNVGVVRGGTRPNVVAAECALEVDIRAVTRDTLVAAETAIRHLAVSHVVPGTTFAIVEDGRHWPMEKLERSGRLVSHAIGLAGELGFELRDTLTGGASDANTTAGMGIPTLDGLGPVGGFDHSPEEYLEVASIVPRTTLLAALIAAIGRDPEVRAWRLERAARAARAAGPEDRS